MSAYMVYLILMGAMAVGALCCLLLADIFEAEEEGEER